MKKNLFLTLLVIFILVLSNLIYAANINSNDNLKYLKQKGITVEQLKLVDESGADLLNDIAERNKLNAEQVKNLVDTYIENLDVTPTYKGTWKRILPDGSICPTLPKKITINNNNSIFSSLNETEYSILSSQPQWQELSWDENNGAHWYIKSKTGYREATGFTTLPTVNVTTNDYPYMYFGAYTSDGALCSDAGVRFEASRNGWYPFVNILIWNPSISGYGQHWKVFDEKKITINNPYINYRVTSYSSYDKFDLVIIDPSDWSTICSYSIKSTDIVSGSNPVNSSYSNLTMTRETTLAQVTENLNNGSYLHNAKWSNVWIYWTTNQDQWTDTYTEEAGKANKPEHWACVTVNSYTPWYEDDISIDY